MRMRYRSSTTVVCTSGAPGTWVFALNSLYDPDVTLTGHQVNLFDEMAALYWNYCVYNVKFKFVVIPVGNETAPSVMCFYPANTNTAAAYTLDEAREQTGAVEAYIGGDRKVVTLSKNLSIREVIGKSRDYVLDSTTYSAQVTGNPTDLAYGILEIGTRDGSSRSYYVEVVADYDCAFSARKQNASS